MSRLCPSRARSCYCLCLVVNLSPVDLGTESRRDLADLRHEPHFDDDAFGIAVNEDLGVPDDDGDPAWQDEEQESLSHAIRDMLGARATTRKYKDARTWRQRVQNLDANWKQAIPRLVKAYLEWRYGTSKPVDEPSDVIPATTTMNILDIYTTSTTADISRSTKSLVEDLVLGGYLGTSPLYPSLAISLKTLELFRSLRKFKPSFSVEAFTKLLCYYYYVGGLFNCTECERADVIVYRSHTTGTTERQSLMRSTYILSSSVISANKSWALWVVRLRIGGQRTAVQHVHITVHVVRNLTSVCTFRC